MTPQSDQEEIKYQILAILDPEMTGEFKYEAGQLLNLFQTAITEAKREMVERVRAEVIGADESASNLMAASTANRVARNGLRYEQRNALTKLTNEIAE